MWSGIAPDCPLFTAEQRSPTAALALAAGMGKLRSAEHSGAPGSRSRSPLSWDIQEGVHLLLSRREHSKRIPENADGGLGATRVILGAGSEGPSREAARWAPSAVGRSRTQRARWAWRRARPRVDAPGVEGPVPMPVRWSSYVRAEKGVSRLDQTRRSGEMTFVALGGSQGALPLRLASFDRQVRRWGPGTAPASGPRWAWRPCRRAPAHWGCCRFPRRPPVRWPPDLACICSPRMANQECPGGFRRISDTFPRICSLLPPGLPFELRFGHPQSQLLIFLLRGLVPGVYPPPIAAGREGNMGVSQPQGRRVQLTLA